MKKIFGLALTSATLICFSFFETSATERFEIKENNMSAYLASRRFDLSLSEDYIREEKEKARQQGFEEGRIEKDKTVALKMLADGIKPEQIARYIKLTTTQIQELEKSLNK